jgi:hypothetical protein
MSAMMRFGLRMILVGCVAIVFGVIWLVSSLGGKDSDGVFAGGIWKGPLLLLAGIAALIVGIRGVREPENDGPKPAQGSAT